MIGPQTTLEIDGALQKTATKAKRESALGQIASLKLRFAIPGHPAVRLDCDTNCPLVRALKIHIKTGGMLFPRRIGKLNEKV